VKFPGGYKQADHGVSFQLYNQEKFPWPEYASASKNPADDTINTKQQKIPGPPKYNGKYDAPAGSPPVVSAIERGQFPPEFEAKYEAFKQKWDAYALSSAKTQNMNSIPPKQGAPPKTPGSLPKIPSDPNKPFDLTATTNQIFDGLKKSGSMGDFYKQHLEEGKQMPIEIEALKAEGKRLGVLQ
jgi:hypothetical protein